ncbi:hypothetical protein ABIE56_000412 [Luteibacter sp. 621]|uniref:hypothetical protein n=1 Tax=Luteibacter sp. 621 TaxID=3373916 RepID=UPI003D229717
MWDAFGSGFPGWGPGRAMGKGNRMGGALLSRDIRAMAKLVRRGFDTCDELFDDPAVPPGGMSRPISALFLAARLDSACSEVLRVPLLLQGGADINAADADGRRLLDFATFVPLRRYLARCGAVSGEDPLPGPFVRAGHMDHPARALDASSVPDEARALRSTQWAGAVPAPLTRALASLGFAGSEALAGERREGQGAPLVYLAWPGPLLYGALASNDVDRAGVLARMNDATVVGDYVGVADGVAVPGLNAPTLAALVDNANRAPRLLTALCEAGVDLSMPDAMGRTPLHLATDECLLGFLLDHVNPWTQRSDGSIIFDSLGDNARTLAEIHRLSRLPETGNKQSSVRRL